MASDQPGCRGNGGRKGGAWLHFSEPSLILLVQLGEFVWQFLSAHGLQGSPTVLYLAFNVRWGQTI